jgi:esterase/lipase superfamily enzyme
MMSHALPPVAFLHQGRIMRSLLIVLALFLAGCANTRPEEGALLPTGILAPGATPVTILAATTRTRIDSPAMFSEVRGKTRVVDHARIVVSLPPGHVPGTIMWPGKPPGDPLLTFTTVSREYLEAPGFAAALNAAMKARPANRRDVLLFIHGYNTDFDEGVYRLAQFSHDSGYPGVPVLFSMASAGSVWGYVYDRDSANVARDGLEATLRALTNDPNVHRVNIFAHSMGSQILMEALRQAHLSGNDSFNDKLGEVVMAAPDIDVELFRTQLASMGGQMPVPATVLISADDGALQISARLAGDEPRLGEYREAREFTSAGITVIDITDLSAGSTGMMGHDKVFASEGLARLVGIGLTQGDRLGNAAPQAGDRIVGRVGDLGSSLGNAVEAVLGVIVVEPARAVTGRRR